MHISTLFDPGDVVRTWEKFTPDFAGVTRAVVEAAPIREVRTIFDDKDGDGLIMYAVGDLHYTYLQSDLRIVECPCGALLRAADVTRGARNYNKQLVCWDCYSELAESAHADRQAEEVSHA